MMAASPSSGFGFLAALVSCVAFGSFAVPIKGHAANSVNIDPLVMQTYKTGMCFLTSWLVLLLGEPLIFTPWGLLSGLFWVPGGTAGIAAVRTAGLAVSQGTWSTLKIMVAFIWGVFIFEEHVRSRINATIAILLMIVGLWGMSFFSSPKSTTITVGDNSLAEPLLSNDNVRISTDEDETNRLIGVKCLSGLSKRQMGLLCAVIDGVWGGSILVPMHFAKSSAEGLGYVISFAIGATVVLISMWTLRFSFHLAREQSFVEAFQQLPGFHFRVMWLPGGLAGLLWSVGNVASMVSVVNLGEGVGYAIVQAQMLVAGLWGLLFYREVQGTSRIASWFFCACITVAGILFLSHEHA